MRRFIDKLLDAIALRAARRVMRRIGAAAIDQQATAPTVAPQPTTEPSITFQNLVNVCTVAGWQDEAENTAKILHDRGVDHLTALAVFHCRADRVQ